MVWPGRERRALASMNHSAMSCPFASLSIRLQRVLKPAGERVSAVPGGCASDGDAAFVAAGAAGPFVGSFGHGDSLLSGKRGRHAGDDACELMTFLLDEHFPQAGHQGPHDRASLDTTIRVRFVPRLLAPSAGGHDLRPPLMWLAISLLSPDHGPLAVGGAFRHPPTSTSFHAQPERLLPWGEGRLMKLGRLWPWATSRSGATARPSRWRMPTLTYHSACLVHPLAKGPSS